MHVKCLNDFLSLLSSPLFEQGYNSAATIYLDKDIEYNQNIKVRYYITSVVEMFLGSELYDVQAQHFLHVLNICSDSIFKLDLIPKEILENIIMFSLKSSNLELIDAGLRLVESYPSSELLSFLKTFRFNEQWLDNYRLAVISDYAEIF